MTISRTTKRRLAYAVTLTLVGFAADQSAAQFVPLGGYAQGPQQVANNPQQVYPNEQVYQNQQAPPVYNGQPYQAAQTPAYQAPTYQSQQPQSQQPTLQQYQQQYQQAAHQQTAQQGYGATPYRVAMGDKLPNPPAETITPVAPTAQAATMQHQGMVHQEPIHHGTNQQGEMYQSYPQHVSHAASGDCGCNNNAQPSTSWESYVAAPTQNYSAGCATGDCGSNYSSYGTTCAPACDVTYASCRPKRQWFGGVYGLYMTRDNPGKEPLSFFVEDATSTTTPYYPASDANFQFTSQADVDLEWGYEFRFGSTFGSDPCGGCQQPFAWEIGYWSLNENNGMSSQVISQDIALNNYRIYGMQNYAGAMYDRAGDGAAGDRPLNDYTDYQMPVDYNDSDPVVAGNSNDVRVLAVRTRQSFEIDNLELNFWRFGCPVESPGIGAQRLASGMGGGGCYSDGCGSGSCGTGCNTGCSSRPPRRFFINGLMGVRYVKIDENWQNAVQFTTVTGDSDTPNTGTYADEPSYYTGGFPFDDNNNLFHDIEADNELVGFQLGCSMNWLVGCKWNFFADSNFGIYGNQIDVYQRLYAGGGGQVYFDVDGGDIAVRSSKSEVAFLGELRTGVGYQVSCNCRLTAAYRLISMSGVALAVEQIPANFANAELVSHIDSNDSILLHGLQTGVEFKY